MKNPTDLELLQCIYNEYIKEYILYDLHEKIRLTQNYVPIDCKRIANKLGAHHELVFGRLLYHLANVYRYKASETEIHNFKLEMKSQGHDESECILEDVSLFVMNVGGDTQCVHFPLVSAVLAQLKDERKHKQSHMLVSYIALGVSIVSLVMSA